MFLRLKEIKKNSKTNSILVYLMHSADGSRVLFYVRIQNERNVSRDQVKMQSKVDKMSTGKLLTKCRFALFVLQSISTVFDVNGPRNIEHNSSVWHQRNVFKHERICSNAQYKTTIADTKCILQWRVSLHFTFTTIAFLKTIFFPSKFGKARISFWQFIFSTWLENRFSKVLRNPISIWWILREKKNRISSILCIHMRSVQVIECQVSIQGIPYTTQIFKANKYTNIHKHTFNATILIIVSRLLYLKLDPGFVIYLSCKRT